MDDIFLPNETEDTSDDSALFDRNEIETEHIAKTDQGHPSGIDASGYVKLTFGRFVTLVANHSFEDVVERNQDEDVILSTNLLTDLANARRFAPAARGPLMIVGGIVFGILLGYFLF